jgi:uncharacterized membrane protein
LNGNSALRQYLRAKQRIDERAFSASILTDQYNSKRTRLQAVDGGLQAPRPIM